MRYALIPAAAILIGSLGCAGDIILPAPETGNPLAQGGWMSATAEASPWNTVFVSVWRGDSYLVLEGEEWDTAESTIAIRLSIRTDVGSDPQVIGPSTSIAADVKYRPWYADPQGWSASGPNGSGTLTLTSLTSNRATGTFSFTAKAINAAANPSTFCVTNGHFDVQFR